MKPLTINKTNQLYFWVGLYFIAGSVVLSLIEMSMNLLILLNGLLLVGVPAVFLAYRYKGESRLKEFVRLNPVSFKTVLYSILLPIIASPIIMACNAFVIVFMPDIPNELNNQVMVGTIAIGFQIVGLGLFPGLFEELLFRGVLIRGVETFNKHFAIVYIAFLFALLHLNPYNFMGPFILGILFGYMLYATNSIIPSMIAHMTNNLMAVGMLFLSTKLQTFVEESVPKGTVETSASSLPTASIILSVIMIFGLIVTSYILLRFIFKKLKEDNQQTEKKREQEQVEMTSVTKKDRWSFIYITPMWIIFISVLYTL